MSAGYRVLWTEVAKKDQGESINFIAGDNP
jgi:hypothetical protein